MLRFFLKLAVVMLPISWVTIPVTLADNLQPPNYYQHIKPIFDKRCVVCHGCYDAPCQLKLSSLSGIQRGAHKNKVYDGSRLLADEPTRLFIDADSVDAWRDKAFFPVINDESNTVKDSLLYQMLLLKARQPLTKAAANNQKLPDDIFDLRLNRDTECPVSQAEFADYADKHALWGMPYALPGLQAAELALIRYWLSAGSPAGIKPELTNRYKQRIEQWESFLNQNTLKAKLVARYIYEHLFLAHLYFSDLPAGQYFKLVRSLTPLGQPVRIIATRRPYEDPQSDPNIDQPVKDIYYRLLPVENTVVAKNHIPYALNKQRLQRFKKLFFAPEYTVQSLPGYAIEQASNPFATFADIPVRSRYRFMLEQARFTIRGFMQGSVCRGQVALNVINDHFWVLFVDPEHAVSKTLGRAFPAQIDGLDLPAERDSNAGLLAHWTEYADLQAKYLQAKSAALNPVLQQHPPSLDWIWQGDGNNKNAALTVFRHFDSASVVKGLVGQPPKTTWLIDYPILERIHYLLVAGFDVYGNAGHQLATRLYMDFLRMESEFNFLALLPKQERTQQRDNWYREVDESVKDYVYGQYAYIKVDSQIRYTKDKPPQQLLYGYIKEYLHKVLAKQHDLYQRDDTVSLMLQSLAMLAGQSASLLPEMGLLLVTEQQKPLAVYTLLRNSAHKNVSSLLNEADNRVPAEDEITIMPGIVGAYPDALWRVESKQLASFVKAVSGLKSTADYSRLMQRFGIRRTHADFWQHSDALHAFYKKAEPLEYGILDYNRLENR